MASVQVRKLIEIVEDLPPEKVTEVIDFAQFLKLREETKRREFDFATFSRSMGEEALRLGLTEEQLDVLLKEDRAEIFREKYDRSSPS